MRVRHRASDSPQKRAEAMSGPPTPKPACPICGAEVPPDAPRGYCHACLFSLGTAGRDSMADATSASSGGKGHVERGSSARPGGDFPSRPFGDFELIEEIARG